MIVRQMIKDDIPRVYSIACTSLDEYYVPDVFSYFLQQWPKGQFVATSYSGEIIGFICGSDLGSDRVGIPLFAVRDDQRGCGVGSKLLHHLRCNAHIEGAHTVQLEVRKENENAIRFYRNRGFMITEVLYSFYRNGGDAIRMIGLASLIS